MITPPRLEYYGDIAQAQALKGAALQFFSFCCLQIGQSSTITRTNKPIDGVVFQATVNKDPYDNLNGVVRISVAIGEGEIPDVLFCTSFNSGIDSGTQIYKAPYPAKTQDGLIDIGSNPNGLILPSPTYSARNNYFVNDKETEAVSWEYVNAVISGINKRYGKITMYGIETDIDWGLYFESLVVGIIKPTDANPTRQQLLVIYRDRVNYSGTGTTRYCAVYDYTLDFIGKKITLTLVSSFNLSAAGYGTKNFIGVLDDECKTVVYTESSSVKYLVLADDYLSVANTGTIFNYVASSLVSTDDMGDSTYLDTYSASESYSGYVDVRGNTVSFCIERMKTRTVTRKQLIDAYGNLYWAIYNESKTFGYELASWKNGTLTRAEYKTGTYDRTSNRSQVDGVYSGSASLSSHQYLFLMYAKKIGESLFNESNETASYTAQSDSTSGWDVVSYSASTKVKSKLAGELFIAPETAYVAYRPLNDYSYTKSCILANINNEFYFVGNIKNKIKKILTDKILKIISVTKLPKVTL